MATDKVLVIYGYFYLVFGGWVGLVVVGLGEKVFFLF